MTIRFVGVTLAGLLLLGCSTGVEPIPSGTFRLVGVDQQGLPAPWPARNGPDALISDELVISGDRFLRITAIRYAADGDELQIEATQGDVYRDADGAVRLRADACGPLRFALCIPADIASPARGGMHVRTLVGGEPPREMTYREQ